MKVCNESVRYKRNISIRIKKHVRKRGLQNAIAMFFHEASKQRPGVHFRRANLSKQAREGRRERERDWAI